MIEPFSPVLSYQANAGLIFIKIDGRNRRGFLYYLCF